MQTNEITGMLVGLIAEQAAPRKKALQILTDTTTGIVRDLDALRASHSSDSQDYGHYEWAIRQRGLEALRVFHRTCHG